MSTIVVDIAEMKRTDRRLKTRMKPPPILKEGKSHTSIPQDNLNNEQATPFLSSKSGERFNSLELSNNKNVNVEFPPLANSYNDTMDCGTPTPSSHQTEEPDPKRTRNEGYTNFFPLPTNNRFAPLTNIIEDSTDNPPSTDDKKPKIPPIFLVSDENYKQIVSDIKSYTQNSFETKQCSHKIKISLTSIEDFRNLTKYYDSNNKKYYSFVNPDERNLSVVIRGVPYMLTDDEIFELLSPDYPVLKVCRLNNKDRAPTPLCAVELTNNEAGKSILNLKTLFHSVVTVELRRKSKSINQCTRCFRLGHTKNYCKLDPRCGKCAGSHFTNLCTSNIQRCVNCNGEHSPQYRGCNIFKKAQEKLFVNPKITRSTQKAPLSHNFHHDEIKQKPRNILPTNQNSSAANASPATEPVINAWTKQNYARQKSQHNRPADSTQHKAPQNELMIIFTEIISPFLPQIKNFICTLLTEIFYNNEHP